MHADWYAQEQDRVSSIYTDVLKTASPFWAAIPRSAGFQSGQFEAAHRSGGGGEFVGLQAHAFEHRDEEVRQRVIMLRIKGEVLAVPKTAAGEKRGQVGGDVGVGVAKVRAVQNHSAIEQCLAVFADTLEFGKQVCQQLHVPFVDRFQLRDLCLRLPVMREVVIAVGDLHVLDVDCRGIDAVQQERYRPS